MASKINDKEFFLLKSKVIGSYEWCVPDFTKNFEVSDDEEAVLVNGPLSQTPEKQYVQKVIGIKVSEKETKKEKRIYWHFTEEEKKLYEETFTESP